MDRMRGWLFFEDFVRLHLLYQATRKPICPAEIVARLDRHDYRLSPRRVRSVLRALERAGYLAGFLVVVGRKRRKYYEATGEGRQVMAVAKTRLHKLAGELLPRPRGFQ